MKAWVWVFGALLVFVVSCGSRPEALSPRGGRLRPAPSQIPCPTGVGDPAVFQERRDRLKSQFGITVDLAPAFPQKDKVEFALVENEEMAVIEVYLGVALEQLAKHAPEFLKAAEIKSFAYVKEPLVEGYPVTGLALFDQGQLLFSVDTENCAPHHIADTLHHEMFHFFHGNPEPPPFEEAEWERLNEAGFHYSESGEKDPEVNHPRPGFVSEYAMSTVGEDTAETFAALMLGNTARLVKEWTATDKVLASKVDFIKRLLSKTSPTYNDDYWEKILQEP